MTAKNDLLLRVLAGEDTPRPPVWLMRQAGRILPEYRAIRSRLSGFKELVETPELACEVTLQPVDLLGVDAAILFSDILVVPEAMGLPYQLVEKVGPRFEETIGSRADLDRLHAVEPEEHLRYVMDAMRMTRSALDGRVPLIGFAGAPWTIFCYMVEGGGSKEWSKARRMLRAEPAWQKICWTGLQRPRLCTSMLKWPLERKCCNCLTVGPAHWTPLFLNDTACPVFAGFAKK